jgi:hypothetical protein
MKDRVEPDGEKAQKEQQHHQIQGERLKESTNARHQDSGQHGEKNNKKQNKVIYSKHSITLNVVSQNITI